MDRTIPIWPLLKGRRAAGVAVAEDGLGRALDNLKTYSDLLELEWAGEVTAMARDPGEVAQNSGVAEMLASLGRKVVHGAGE